MGKTIIIIICDEIRTNSLQESVTACRASIICFFKIRIKGIVIRFFRIMVNHGNSFLQNQNQTKCNSFQE